MALDPSTENAGCSSFAHCVERVVSVFWCPGRIKASASGKRDGCDDWRNRIRCCLEAMGSLEIKSVDDVPLHRCLRLKVGNEHADVSFKMMLK
jgi:hypothetical protein